jgi:hypothetical protein
MSRPSFDVWPEFLIPFCNINNQSFLYKWQILSPYKEYAKCLDHVLVPGNKELSTK